MKSSIKFLAIIALFCSFAMTATAQRGGRDFNPEQVAEKQTTRMTEKLELDKAQTAEVKAINLKYAQQMHEAKEANKEEREAMRETVKSIHTDKKAELKNVLNDEQYATYEELVAKKMQHRRGKRGGKGKGADATQEGKQ